MSGFDTVIILVILLIVWPHQPLAETPDNASADERPGGSYVYNDTRPSKLGHIPQWDPQGYVFFCLCMGVYIFKLLVNQIKFFFPEMITGIQAKIYESCLFYEKLKRKLFTAQILVDINSMVVVYCYCYIY